MAGHKSDNSLWQTLAAFFHISYFLLVIFRFCLENAINAEGHCHFYYLKAERHEACWEHFLMNCKRFGKVFSSKNKAQNAHMWPETLWIKSDCYLCSKAAELESDVSFCAKKTLYHSNGACVFFESKWNGIGWRR